MKIKIFDLECKVNHYEEVSEGNKDGEDDDTSNAAGLQDEPCSIFYSNCPCHKTTVVLVTFCIVVFVMFF